MDYWKAAYQVADIVLENSRLMWIVYISYFVIALKVRKKEIKTRKRVGALMIGASVPGLLISAGCLGLFVYAMIKCYRVAASKEFYILGDSPVVRHIQQMCNSVPVTCLVLSLFLFYILAVIAVMCGIIILARRAGKGAGLFTLIYGNIHSPLFAYWRLGAEAKEAARVRKELESIENCTAGFYRKGISCASVERPDTLGDNPNIVLILMEGTSEHIVKDERGIMPNAAELEKKSISFSNYYNHTFATYRGISGQLYSGFQLDNYDSNSLIGIQDILSDKGYYTSFINTEPNLVPFATIEEKSAGSQPFFTAIYTFGTHASFDSPDEKFGDGSLAELNKFYNADHWLGNFLEKLEASPAFDNTLVVFTADHSTYADLYYNEAFPDYQRQNPTIDSIPLMFYHKGVVPQEIDAAGRNTLDLTSTILDYVDIDAPNYFLGASLFHDPDNYNNLDTIFTSSVDLYSTKGGKIRKLEETEAETAIVREMVQNYYAAKLQIPMTP